MKAFWKLDFILWNSIPLFIAKGNILQHAFNILNSHGRVHFNLGAERVVGAVCKRTPSVKLCGLQPRLRNLAPNVKYTRVTKYTGCIRNLG
jgi:hypothetical protein